MVGGGDRPDYVRGRVMGSSSIRAGIKQYGVGREVDRPQYGGDETIGRRGRSSSVRGRWVKQ